MKFTYLRGDQQEFAINGDDDMWVFINDSLVIDLAGVHSSQSGSGKLDALPDGFLTDAQEYSIDFFHAERHTNESRLSVKTNCVVVPYGPRPSPGRAAVLNGRSGLRLASLDPRRDGNGIHFVAPSAGSLSLYSVAGKDLGSIGATANQSCRIAMERGSSPVLYQWAGSTGTSNGMLLNAR